MYHMSILIYSLIGFSLKRLAMRLRYDRVPENEEWHVTDVLVGDFTLPTSSVHEHLVFRDDQGWAENEDISHVHHPRPFLLFFFSWKRRRASLQTAGSKAFGAKVRHEESTCKWPRRLESIFVNVSAIMLKRHTGLQFWPVEHFDDFFGAYSGVLRSMMWKCILALCMLPQWLKLVKSTFNVEYVHVAKSIVFR